MRTNEDAPQTGLVAAAAVVVARAAMGAAAVVGAAGAESPEDLGRLFAQRQAAGDVDGIVALYSPDAVVSLAGGREAAGRPAIRAAFVAAFASGSDLSIATVGTPIVAGALACTTSTTTSGAVLTQVARRASDGTWCWVRDGHRLVGLVPVQSGDGLSEVA